MKKLLILALVMLSAASLFGKALLTNSNQSSSYIRMLSRNPSTDIDAVYYNPAGLVKLADGWHLAFYNQTIMQEKKIINEFPLLNNAEYIGKVNVPMFPNAYAVYKKDRLALSFGFGPNAGGGSADFARGLPSFETNISSLPLMISMLGIQTTTYSADIALEGKSIFLGFQGNVSYALNDSVALAAGLRLIKANNSYSGHIKNIMINPLFAGNPTAAMIPASTFFMMIGQPGMAAALGDMEVDAEQKGSAVTPILSLFLTPSSGLSISLKYEFQTNLELENFTARDDTGTFPDGLIFRNDIPAILSAGLKYEFNPELRALLSFNYFFDKNADWEGKEEFVNSNSWEFSLGAEYDLSSKLTLSAGYLRTNFDLADSYQTDIGHELSSNSFGLGARINLSENLNVELGTLFISYNNTSRPLNTLGLNYNESYSRKTTVFSVGLGYRF